MKRRLHELRHLFFMFNKGNITLRSKLLAYLLFMSLTAFGILILVLATSGAIFNFEHQVRQVLEIKANQTAASVQDVMDIMTGYGDNMARNLSHQIEYQLEEHGLKKVEGLDNQPEILLDIQKDFFAELNTTLKVTRSSGTYATLNATINTEAPHAEKYRSGVYLRLANVGHHVQLDPDIFYFRGIPDIAREKGLELHNRWNLEFDIDAFPEFTECFQAKQKSGFWTDSRRIQDSWEKAMFYHAPLYGSQGEFYGVCGVELSDLYMKLSYPVVETEFGPAMTVMAPLEKGQLEIGKGLVGGSTPTWNDRHLSLVENNNSELTYYQDGVDSYLGIEKPVSIAGKDEQNWKVVVLIPHRIYMERVSEHRARLILSVFLFILCMGTMSLIISRKFVHPIVKGLEFIQTQKDYSTFSTGISELDVLIRFLESQPHAEQLSDRGLPEDIEELLVRFSEGIKTLSAAEYHVFHFYLEGHSVSQIPELAFISMSTVKKHNRNIYTKLGISSNDELLLLIDLFRRCGRIEELHRQE